MILFFFFSISGICAPFDMTDCDYTIVYYPDAKYPWGHYYDKTLYFGGEYWNYEDCWGLNTWEHEWLHAEKGSWHEENQQCIIRVGHTTK